MAASLPEKRNQSPLREMPTGRGRNRARSRLRRTAAADCRETSCSGEQPPKSTTTFS